MIKRYNRISEILADRGTTVKWLAGRVDLDYATMTKLVNNRCQTKITTLFKIAKALNVHPGDLLNHYKEVEG